MAGKARVKRTPSKEEIAYQKAKDEYKKAKEKAAKSNSEADNARAAELKKVMQEHHAPVKVSSFKRIAEARTGKAILATRNIGNLFSPRTYTYTKEQGEKLLAALRAEMDALEAKFTASLSTAPATAEAKAKAFSFD